MHSLEYENHSNGSYMIYHIQPEESVNTIVLGMVTNNDIEGILKMSKVQVNSEIQIRYSISAKRQLKEYLQNEHLTSDEILDILFSILNTIVNAQEYMIRPEEFVLDTEYIYIDIHTKKPYIMCVPVILKQTSAQNIGIFVKTYIYSIGYTDTDKDVLAVNNRIMSATNNKKTVAEFRDAVRKEMLIRHDGQQKNTAYDHSEIPNKNNADNHIVEAEKKHKIQYPNTETEKKSGLNFGYNAASNDDMSNRQSEISENKKASSGLNVAAFEIPGGMNISKKISEKKGKSSGKGLFSGLSKRLTKNNVQGDKKVSVNPIVPLETARPKPYNPAVEEQAAVLETSDKTILSNQIYTSQNNSSLLRVRNNEIIIIDKEYFKLGRDREKVDYQISNPLVSKEHAAIIRRGSDYYITDINFSNHTYVDGKMLNNGEEVMLRDNSQIRIADENFVFKTNF